MDHEWIHQVMSHCFKPPRRFLSTKVQHSVFFVFFCFFHMFFFENAERDTLPGETHLYRFTVFTHNSDFCLLNGTSFSQRFPKKTKKLKTTKRKNLARIHRYENPRKHVRFWSSVFMSQRWPVRPALGASTPKIHLWLRSQSNSAHVAHSGMPFTEQAGLYGIIIEPPSKIYIPLRPCWERYMFISKPLREIHSLRKHVCEKECAYRASK